VRRPVDDDRIRAFARALGAAARADTTLYLAGGASAVLHGWRAATLDVDLRVEPETDEVLLAISRLKDRLDINIELTSPADFIPELPDWRERSAFAFREGRVEVRHFDFYSQALSKIERGFAQDLEDVRSMLRDGLVDPERLKQLFEDIEPELFRYPAIDAAAFRGKVERALE
jgi:hypothetical protein